MEVEQIDHIVLIVQDVDRTVAFYTRVLGMHEVVYAHGRRALHFGSHKLNLHRVGDDVAPRAAAPTPGSAELCVMTHTPLDQVVHHLRTCDVAVEHGPVERIGATGRIHSVFVRDPDGNLVEIANAVAGAPHTRR